MFALRRARGLRFCGGRHLTMLVIYTPRPRSSPMLCSIKSNSFPAGPTKGSPCRSSSCPGPSPTNITSACRSPTPKTARLRFSESGQRAHASTAARSGSHAMRTMALSSAATGGGEELCETTSAAGDGFSPRSTSVLEKESRSESPPSVRPRLRHSGDNPNSLNISARIVLFSIGGKIFQLRYFTKKIFFNRIALIKNKSCKARRESFFIRRHFLIANCETKKWRVGR